MFEFDLSTPEHPLSYRPHVGVNLGLCGMAQWLSSQSPESLQD